MPSTHILVINFIFLYSADDNIGNHKGEVMKIMKIVMILLLVPACSGAFMHAMDDEPVSQNSSKQIALFVDLGDVICGIKETSLTDYMPMATRIAFHHFGIARALPHAVAITAYARDLEARVNGASNVVHEMITYLKQYANLSDYEDEILHTSQKPYPIKEMVAHITRLKQEGHPLIAATNEDWKQYTICAAKMREQGVDFDQLFDAILTTRVKHVDPPEGDGAFYKLHPNNAKDRIYVVRNHEVYKPHTAYFEIAQALSKQVAPASRWSIHTDDKQENVEGARNAGIEGIWFKLPGGKVDDTSDTDLVGTIQQWVSAIEETIKRLALTEKKE